MLTLWQDSQLWFDDADCLVHFYARGVSQRGPSLRVPFNAVEKLNCSYLLDHCLHTRTTTSPASEDSGYGSSLSTVSELEKSPHELYIPAPSSLTREQAFSYHLTTRNVFAYAVGRAVVGEKLSTALLDLWIRLLEWLPALTARSDYSAYLQEQGYLHFTENSEHALACLKFAEEGRFGDIWMDAFAHCAGMHERLFLSPEFPGLSNTTSALITRATLEMDLHIERVTRAVGGFLEEEFGPEYLGLSKAARDHLDHFRSCLHAFYVAKLGYFPPRESHPWDKRPWRKMYQDFQRLYHYLADTESTSDLNTSRALTGGVCVVQNVQAFDERHGYQSLPHPLPLLPQPSTPQRRRSINSQTTLRNLKLGRTNVTPEPVLTPKQALAVATNDLSPETNCLLVQEYQRFERQKLDSKLDLSEARKVRWLLIYSVLQMLISIMRGPKEVSDPETPTYPLCVLTNGCPSFSEEDVTLKRDVEKVTESMEQPTLVPDALDALEGRSARISIHPDCEADSADEFFASNAIARQDSSLSLSDTPAPLRITTQPSRTASIRSSMHSSVNALHKSVVGSLSRRNSIRRENVHQEPRKVRSHTEILVQDYGNGLYDVETMRPLTAIRPESDPQPKTVDPLLQFEFDFGQADSEPTLEYHQLGTPPDKGTDVQMNGSPSESYFSLRSSGLLDSNRSSYLDEDAPDTDISSLDDEDRRQDTAESDPSTPMDTSDIPKPNNQANRLCYRPSHFKLAAEAASATINAGCYKPTGFHQITAPVSKFAHQRTLSGETMKSNASSDYPEDSVQAADIEELEMRGRRRSRAMDRLYRQAGLPVPGVV